MRILHLTTYLQGGAGRIITDLATAQRRSGHDVRIVSDAGQAPGYESYPEYLDDLAAADVSHLRLCSTFHRDEALNRAATNSLTLLFDEWLPDLCHAHAALPGAIARRALSTRAPRPPLVHTMHGWGVNKTSAQAHADVTTLALADAVVTPSRAAREALHDAGLCHDDVRVIRYEIAEERTPLEPTVADLELWRHAGSGRKLAICIGTVGARKNQRLLVDALADTHLADVTAVFIGEGETETLATAAFDAGVADRVVVLGHRPRAGRYLQIADALVLPSRNEGLPLVVLEAVRAEVPVVASRLPEIVEALEGADSTGLFVPDDVVDLRRALRTIIEPTERRRGRTCGRSASSPSASPSRMVRDYEQLYAEVTRTLPSRRG